MRALLLVGLVGCSESIGLGPASSARYPTATSATVTVANVQIGLGQYRLWSVEIGEDAPGTDCHARGDALMTFDVYTIFSSAPRGEILYRADDPPVVFPTLYAAYADALPVDGVMTIDAASTANLFGSFAGSANYDGTILDVDVTFEATTCGV